MAGLGRFFPVPVRPSDRPLLGKAALWGSRNSQPIGTNYCAELPVWAARDVALVQVCKLVTGRRHN